MCTRGATVGVRKKKFFFAQFWDSDIRRLEGAEIAPNHPRSPDLHPREFCAPLFSRFNFDGVIEPLLILSTFVQCFILYMLILASLANGSCCQ